MNKMTKENAPEERRKRIPLSAFCVRPKTMEETQAVIGLVELMCRQRGVEYVRSVYAEKLGSPGSKLGDYLQVSNYNSLSRDDADRVFSVYRFGQPKIKDGAVLNIAASLEEFILNWCEFMERYYPLLEADGTADKGDG